MSRYPNLPLIQERFGNALRMKDLINESIAAPSYDVVMFSQTFGTRNGISEEIECEGTAAAKQYVTVIREEVSGICGVFGENTLAYVVPKPNLMFERDLTNRKMSEKWKAKVTYEKII